MVSKIRSIGLYGIDAYDVQIQADISPKSKAAFDIVGLPDSAVRESRDRVRSAIKNSGYRYPLGHITVNLAPADVKKEGSVYDLPVLLSLLIAGGQIEPTVNMEECIFIGEVSLDGSLRHVNGVLAMAISARQNGIKNFFVPSANAAEGSVVEGINIYGADTIEEVISHITGFTELMPTPPIDISSKDNRNQIFDFSEVKGQAAAKRALEIAAAGGHNILIIGHIYLLSKNEPRCA